MRYTITGRNIEVTPGLKAAVEKKIGKLEHFFTPDTEVFVALSAQKDIQKIEVTIPVKGNTIRAEESSTDMHIITYFLSISDPVFLYTSDKFTRFLHFFCFSS